MKRIIFIAIILLFTSGLYAQKDSSFYRHEVKLSYSEALTSSLWFKNMCHSNISIAYFYRPMKWFWIGINFNNYIGPKLYYDWREYDDNGRYKDFLTSKIKYCAAVAPEIRFSYLNNNDVVLYSSLSAGIGWENGYDDQWQKFPRTFSYLHITGFGVSCSVGKNNNVFLGGELGFGMKGFGCIHVGYRF